MFRAFGFLIVLWGLSTFFASAFVAFESAMATAFEAIEVAAERTKYELQSRP